MAKQLARGLWWWLRLRHIWIFDRAMVCTYDTAKRPAGKSDPELSVEKANRAAIGDILRWGLEDREEYEERMDRGEVLFVGRIGGAVVGMQWMAFHRWDSDWMEHSMPLGEDAWFHDAYVDPAYRRRGIYTAILRHALRWAEARGHAHAYCLVMRRNRPSVRAHERDGWLPYEHITYCRLLFLAYQRIHRARGNSAVLRIGPLVLQRGEVPGQEAELPSAHDSDSEGRPAHV